MGNEPQALGDREQLGEALRSAAGGIFQFLELRISLEATVLQCLGQRGWSGEPLIKNESQYPCGVCIMKTELPLSPSRKTKRLAGSRVLSAVSMHPPSKILKQKRAAKFS